MVDSVAQALPFVQKQLDVDDIKYSIAKTSPTRDLEKLDETSLYVIRQQVDANNICHLIVAAKMAKREE